MSSPITAPRASPFLVVDGLAGWHDFCYICDYSEARSTLQRIRGFFFLNISMLFSESNTSQTVGLTLALRYSGGPIQSPTVTYSFSHRQILHHRDRLPTIPRPGYLTGY